jgi:hypothetical protein
VKHSGEGDEDANNHLRRAHQFIQMLPFNYVKNRKLSISWQGLGDFNDFVPCLRRGEGFFSPRSITLSQSNLILNKNTKILTFIMGAEELHLERCKISLSEVSNETNYVRTLRRLVMVGCEETVNFVQGLGESEELVLRDTVIKLAQNRSFVPQEHATSLKIENCRFRYLMSEEPRELNVIKIKELIGA